jgi:hypothetical protein
MRANLFIGILIGVLIFVAILWYQNRGSVEGFTTTSTPETTTTPAPETTTPSTFEAILATLNADPANFKYIEPKESIPAKETLQLYYSSFSDKTLANTDTYIPNSQNWNNHLANDQSFFLLTSQVLPVNIKPPHGLALKNLALNGIASDKLNPTNTTHTLGSFTASFYCRFNTITFEGENPIEVFSIYLESPNYVRLQLRPSKKEDNSIDPDNVDIALQLGNPDNVYIVQKPKDALLASGNYILLSFVYDETSITIDKNTGSKLYLYIGNNEKDNYNAFVTPKPSLLLGNSPMRINSTTTLDVNLQAFAFYNSALSFTSHKELLDYFSQQQSGMKSILDALKAMTASQITAVQNYVQDQTVTVEDLQKQLEECQAIPKKEDEKKFKYGIDLPEGAEGVSATDLESCSILGVKKRGEKALPAVTPPTSVAAESGKSEATTAAAPPPTQNRFAINIPFLKDILPKSFTTSE